MQCMPFIKIRSRWRHHQQITWFLWCLRYFSKWCFLRFHKRIFLSWVIRSDVFEILYEIILRAVDIIINREPLHGWFQWFSTIMTRRFHILVRFFSSWWFPYSSCWISGCSEMLINLRLWVLLIKLLRIKWSFLVVFMLLCHVVLKKTLSSSWSRC